MLVRNCNLGREYLRSVLQDEAAGDESQESLKVRRDIGKLTVVAARFSRVDGEELAAARALLADYADVMNDLSAAAYYLEASLEQYHSSGGKELLIEAVRWAPNGRLGDLASQ
ncbi:hypothetical protein ABIQ69_13555 [Agromyces sp. G08B096]|uniref:Uncharacterized protein n=1 Tax=Agromyces sp. G08B096 TaxID=3156399 RepID=A0AAU7W6Q3_9MICO